MAYLAKRSYPILTNDGFGPQLTGKESIIDFFDNEQTVRLTLDDQKERLVIENLDPKLRKKLQAFKTTVSRETPKFKFDILCLWLENEVVEMVIRRQAKTKRLGKILDRNATLEEQKDIKGLMKKEHAIRTELEHLRRSIAKNINKSRQNQETSTKTQHKLDKQSTTINNKSTKATKKNKT